MARNHIKQPDPPTQNAGDEDCQNYVSEKFR